MTTYTNPYSFCRIVVELLADRGWKIKSGRSTGDLGIQSYSLPDGLVAVGGVGGKLGRFWCFLQLCEKFVAQHSIPIKFDRDAFKTKYGEGKEPVMRPSDFDPFGFDAQEHPGDQGVNHENPEGFFERMFAKMDRDMRQQAGGFDPGGFHFKSYYHWGVDPAAVDRDSDMWKVIYTTEYRYPCGTEGQRNRRQERIDNLYRFYQRKGHTFTTSEEYLKRKMQYAQESKA